jgi:hypothetical protein
MQPRQSPKATPYNDSRRLTLPEIEALRQHKRETLAYMRARRREQAEQISRGAATAALDRS